MTISTITAEGGTIRLTTASDGSVSASSGDFAVAVVQQVIGGGSTTPTIPSPYSVGPISGTLIVPNIIGAVGVSGVVGVVNRQIISPFCLAHDYTISEFGYSSASSTSNTQKAILFASDANGRPTSLILQGDSLTHTSSGFKPSSRSYTLLAGVLYWGGLWQNGTPSIYSPPTTSLVPLAYNEDANPVPYTSLIRTVTYDAVGNSPDWVYDVLQLSTIRPPAVMFRVA